ncbi:hypothetical protein L208DRAFT_1380133 [Tricholoma matsutake]|nr:hypothetical protein L208DRAFT_1380133 [Tricholoma matsutake 945]
MSDSSLSSPGSPIQYTFVPSSALALSTGKKSKTPKAVKKETKSKTFDYRFKLTDDNYINFLKNLLKECSAMKYDTVDKKQFGIKCGTKKVKSDATDIDCGEEYREFVKKSVLVDASSARPKRVMVWLDIEEVKRVFKSRDADSSSNSDGKDLGDSGMSKKDDELARLHGKLEKQWGNNSDSSYAYIDHITGQCFPLTPFMMDEWVRGMYDGKATVDMLPAETCFDPANCLTSIAPPHS